jgi:hypothetical protein
MSYYNSHFLSKLRSQLKLYTLELLKQALMHIVGAKLHWETKLKNKTKNPPIPFYYKVLRVRACTADTIVLTGTNF